MLTALEFHQELVEDGSELDILKKQFGAPPPQSSDLYSLNTESFKLPGTNPIHDLVLITFQIMSKQQ